MLFNICESLNPTYSNLSKLWLKNKKQLKLQDERKY